MKKRHYAKLRCEEIITQEATEKHNEITVIKRWYYISVPMIPAAFRAAMKLLKPYHKDSADYSAIMLSAKTERRGNDKYDKDLGIRIARAKVERKLWKLILKLNDLDFAAHLSEYNKLERKEEFLLNCISREEKYIEKLCNK